MNIGIDLTFYSNIRTGISNYTFKLLEYFNKVDTTNKYFLYTSNDLPSEIKFNENFIIKKLETKHIHLYYLLFLKKQLMKDKINLFFGPSFYLPAKSKKYKMVTTFHDLSIIKTKNSSYHKFFKYHISKLFHKKACKDAYKIIAISESTKNDIKDCFNIADNKIEVIYDGYSDYTRLTNITSEETNSILKKFSINVPFILSVNTIEPRKNLINSVKAFELYKGETNSSIKYVIVGKLGWKYEPIVNSFKNSIYSKDILYLNYVTPKEKEVLYRNALYTSFVSLYEGFGLPITESLSVGTPVLTSNISSMPEAGGDVCYYVNNPYNIEEIKEKMHAILDDIKSGKIDKERLYKQAEKFRADDFCKATHQLFQNILNNKI